jgi:hypothetical protein
MGICPVIHQGGLSADCVGDYRHLSMIEEPRVSQPFSTRGVHTIRDYIEQCLQRANIGVLTLSIDVCTDGASDERSTATGVKGTVLGSLKIILVVSRLQVYRVPLTFMVIWPIKTNNVVAQLWRDKVIAPVVNYGIVDGDGTVEMVMMNKIL